MWNVIVVPGNHPTKKYIIVKYFQVIEMFKNHRHVLSLCLPNIWLTSSFASSKLETISIV